MKKMCQVYVGNLNPNISDTTIEEKFRPFSQSVRITRKTPRYAFAEFDDRDDALQAIRYLDGMNRWVVKLSHRSMVDGGCGGDRVDVSRRCNDCGKLGILTWECCGFQNECSFPSRGDEREAYPSLRNRENSVYGDEDQRKTDVNEVPINQHCNQGSVGSKPGGTFEPEQPLFDELLQKLMAKIDEKVRESGVVSKENESLKSQLNEANLKIASAKAKEEELTLKLKKLSEELEQTKCQVNVTKVKEEEMSLMLKKLRDDLAKSKASELRLKVKKLEEELRKSEKNAVQLNAKLKEVQGAKETLLAETRVTDEKTEEWRKAADAAAAIFAVGVEINTEISESKSPILCYINHATTQKSLGKIREALWYCSIAATLDSNSPEVQLTSANCHLVIGEIKDALYYYKRCQQSETILCTDKRFMTEATDGVQKAQKVASCIKHSSELLQQRTFSAATKALEVIGEALLISCFSEKLLEMKGEALFALRKYEEAVQVCEITLDFAEKNFDAVVVVDGKNLSKTWRWNLMAKSYFRLGRLEIALNFIEKQENLRSTEDRAEESMSPLAATVRELLRCKNAGNEAFQSKKYTEAVKHYTNALSRSTESHPFSAVCLANRAAAYKALGEIVVAIADCNLALALDGSYQKALFRRATLHEMIRDYEKATCDLKRFISLCDKQSQCRKTGSDGDVKQARHRLSFMEETTKRGPTMNLYLILGVNASDSTSQIKKAYRKAALRHHPDKVGQFLAKSDCGYDALLWKEISETISKDADGLFKIIGKAYSVLSDSKMRAKYDYEEEARHDEEEDEDDYYHYAGGSDEDDDYYHYYNYC